MKHITAFEPLDDSEPGARKPSKTWYSLFIRKPRILDKNIINVNISVDQDKEKYHPLSDERPPRARQ